MIDVIEQFPNAIKAESKDKNTLILRELDNYINRFDGKKAKYEVEYRWHRMNITENNISDVNCVQGNEFSYWTKKELDFNKPLFEQLNLF